MHVLLMITMITLWQTYKQLLKMAVYSEICPVKMVMFNTYVKLPEGRHLYCMCLCGNEYGSMDGQTVGKVDDIWSLTFEPLSQ